MENEREEKKRKVKDRFLVAIIILVIIVVLILVAIYINKDSIFNNETTDEENQGVVSEEELSVDEELPTDEELLTRSKELVSNLQTLWFNNYSRNSPGYGGTEYTFDGISLPLYLITSDNDEITSKINDTFIDLETAYKYIPYYYTNGNWYTCDCNGGITDGWSVVFDYTITEKTSNTATIIVDKYLCEDDVEDIDECNTFVDYEDKGVITLNLVNQNDKWLISSLTSNYSMTLFDE